MRRLEQSSWRKETTYCTYYEKQVTKANQGTSWEQIQQRHKRFCDRDPVEALYCRDSMPYVVYDQQVWRSCMSDRILHNSFSEEVLPRMSATNIYIKVNILPTRFWHEQLFVNNQIFSKCRTANDSCTAFVFGQVGLLE